MHDELRTEPRQRRSQRSIDSILDAAERLVRAQGQVSFTAHELATDASMSIGRIYYWFTDIPAVVHALAERAARRLDERVGAAMRASAANSSDPVAAYVTALTEHVTANPATVALCLTGPIDGYSASVRGRLHEQATALVAASRPGGDDPERVARTVVAVSLGMLHSSTWASGTDGATDDLTTVLRAALDGSPS